jgi:DNA-directed RNA polymerase subunit alpha
MRVRWRNFELPTRVVCKTDVSTLNYGEFIAEPFERGFGRTIGNALRRILLSSIEGGAVTSIKIGNVNHEFSSIEGVIEDVCDIVIAMKKLRIKIDTEEEDPITLKIDVKKKGTITGADINTNGKAVIVNKDLVIATLVNDIHFYMEIEARKGRGYVTAEENTKENPEIGIIPIASMFSPVQHVEYNIENTRVGQITNYDRLILKIKTDATISPEMALVEASKILRKHLNPFVQYFELGNEITNIKEPLPTPIEKLEDITTTVTETDTEPSPTKKPSILDSPVETLGLSVRASNCLSAAGIHFIRDLVKFNEEQLLEIRSLGKTSLKEIEERLKIYNLELPLSNDSLKN